MPSHKVKGSLVFINFDGKEMLSFPTKGKEAMWFIKDLWKIQSYYVSLSLCDFWLSCLNLWINGIRRVQEVK